MHAASNKPQAATIFILVTVFLDVFAFGLIIPVLPHLIKGFFNGDQGQATVMSAWLSTMYWVLQFFTSPLLGALGDRYGRRPVLLLSNLAIGLDFIVMALANSFLLLFIGRAINGIAAANFSTASAYIADVTPPEKRAQTYGMMGAAFGIGFIVGPALGGFLAHVDPKLPFWCAAGLSLANFMYGYFVLPESLKPENRAPISFARLNPFSAMRWLYQKPQLFGLVAVVFLSSFAHVVYPSTFVLFADYRYSWTELDVGLALGTVGLLAAIMQGGVMKHAIKRFGEKKLVLFGLSAGIIGFTAYGLAPTGAYFIAAMPIMACWGLAGPSAQSLMSQQIAANEQGRMQGAMSSMNSLANIFGPLAFAHMFEAFVKGKSGAAPPAGLELPGAAFFLAAFALVLALAVAYFVLRKLEFAAVSKASAEPEPLP
jgi:MFS transporter, DHA1 family, tetracycline resistance protein